MPEELNQEVEEEKDETSVLADKLTSVAVKQIEACVKFKQPRMYEIQKSEDLYNHKLKKAPKGRWNIPLPVMSGFVDTLLSKTDDPVVINFGYRDKADYKRAIKTQAAWEVESSQANGNWDKVDRCSKKQAIFSGLGIYKYYAESDPKYKSNFEVPDIYDFIFEPNGGNILEEHLFTGEQNIFKTKSQLLTGAFSGLYNRTQVKKLLYAANATALKQNEEIFKNKIVRFKSLGLDNQTNNYVGQDLYTLCEHYMVWNNKRYYLLFDYRSGIWVRFQEIKEVFESELYPYVTWQTNEDRYNILSKAPADDIRPVADGMRVIFNQMLDNLEHRNWNQKIINPDMFSDLSEFNYRPNGLIKLKPGTTRPVSEGVFEFPIDDNTNGVIDVMGFLKGFLATETGITPGTQGQAERDKKVGIFYGEMAQVADRIGLQSKAYTEAWAQVGKRYFYGLKENFNEKINIKITGAKGIENEEFKREDVAGFKDEPEIYITGGNSEKEVDLAKQEAKNKALAAVISNPQYAQKLNPDWAVENILSAGGWESEDIKRGMDIENYGNEEIIAEAEQAIQAIIQNKKPELNRGANSAWAQYILDFSTNTSDLKPDVVKRLRDFIVEHTRIIQENTRKSVGQMATNSAVSRLGQGGMPSNTNQPDQSGAPAPGQPPEGVRRAQAI